MTSHYPRISATIQLLLVVALIPISNAITELEILEIFYGKTEGYKWKNNTNWVGGSDAYCNWHGVSCNSEEEVKKLELSENNMGGTFASEIYLLPKLEELNFKDDDGMTFTFDGIVKADNLKRLILQDAGITSIEGIGEAPSLSYVDISRNGELLKGNIPSEIYDMTSLRTLFLDRNAFTGNISPDIGLLTNLEYMDFFGNSLDGKIPTEVGKLTSLKDMGLAGNNLEGTIPSQIVSLNMLSGLFLHMNSFTGRIPRLKTQPDLKSVYLSDNFFHGSIPHLFLNEVDRDVAVEIHLSHNSLTGSIPDILGEFDDLTLYAEDNLLTGYGPACDKKNWNDAAIFWFNCSGFLCPAGTYNSDGRETENNPCHNCPANEDGVIGNVECNIGPSPTPPSPTTSAPHAQSIEDAQAMILDELYDTLGGSMWRNQNGWNITDASICSRYGVVCDADGGGGVTKINLKANNLKGELPPSIFNLASLNELNFHQNPSLYITEESVANIGAATELTHLIVAEIGSLYVDGLVDSEKLSYLDISKNNIGGNMPKSLFNLSDLKILFLHGNTFSGTIPTELNQLSNLLDFDLSNNELTGSITSETFENLVNINYLKMNENLFSGPIPTEVLKKMTNLIQLHLNHNYFTGPIPEFDGATNLEDIGLSSNKLTGTISPNLLGSMDPSDKVFLDISGNLITGTIPAELKNLKLDINFADNYFSAIDSSLCSSLAWGNDPDTCDDIMCPSGTFNQYGKQTLGVSCETCYYYSANFMGSTTCNATSAEELDRAVLDIFFDDLNGISWQNTENWRTDTSICSWYGVSCTDVPPGSSDGVVPLVKKLQLDANGLVGNLPTQLFDLLEIEHVDLRENNVKVDFKKVTKRSNSTIRKLVLEATGLTDLSGIHALDALEEVDLSMNLISGTFPASLLQIQTLKKIYLDNNQISGTFPTDIVKLSNLVSFDMFNNNIAGTLPSSLSQLSNLEDFEVGKNSIIGSAQSIATIFKDMPKLWGLYLGDQAVRGGTGITGTLPSFTDFKGLIQLNLQGNSLTGPIPSGFLSSVPGNEPITIKLGNNQLTGALPNDLSSFQSFDIDINDNLITGIPASLCEKTLWQKGDVAKFKCDAIACKPGFSSPVGMSKTNENGAPSTTCKPCEIPGQVPYFGSRSCEPHESLYDKERDSLNAFYNNCGGDGWKKKDNWLSDAPVCSWYGVTCNNEKLVASIIMGSNNVKCSDSNISPLWNLGRLSNLWLYSNPLNSVDFSNIGKARNLTSLLLDSTGLTDVSGVGKAGNLKELDLRFNAIAGSFPTELFKLIHLKNLALTSNSLVGVLPASFASLGMLEKLRLDINAFTGSLPMFSNLPKLRWVDLSSNSFSGTIPAQFMGDVNANNLEIDKVVMDISGNMLTGTVPAELARFEYLNLYLKSNKFTEIDPVLCNKDSWNEGDVADFQCDGILCPIGTYNSQGRQTSNENVCNDCESAKYIGGDVCARSFRVTCGTGMMTWSVVTLLFGMFVI